MHRVTLFLIDLFLVALATVCALVLRDNLAPSIARLHHLLPYLVASLVAALVILPALGSKPSDLAIQLTAGLSARCRG